MFHHQILKKYTIALLDTFNNIKIPVFSKKGKILKETPVPIQFGNREKAYSINNITKNIRSGNNYNLPRMALSFSGFNKAPQRDTSKYTKINLKSKEDDRKRVEFQFNSVAYDFNFTLHIATKTLNEMMFITESITPLFRPTYTIPVYEIDIQQDPTNIILELSSVDLELPLEQEEEDIRIIKCELPLILRGNMYLPIQDEALITKIRLYYNEKIGEHLQYALEFYNFEIDENNYFNQFYSNDKDFIENVRRNEGNKGW